MPTKRCCCPGDCLITSDDFDRANSTDIGSDWEEMSGDWDIFSNKLRCFDPAGVVRNKAQNPYSDNQVVRARIMDYVDGAKYRLLVHLDDTGTEYYYGEWHYVDSSAMYVRVGSSVDGSLCEIGPILPIPEGTTCEVSITEGGQLCVQDLASRCTVCVSPKAYEVYTGLAAGSAVVATFDDYEFYAHKADIDECPSCDCSCDGKCIPDDLTATYENLNQCPDLDDYSVSLKNSGPTKFGADWYQDPAADCPGSIPETLELVMKCTGGGTSIGNLQLEFLQGSATPSSALADPSVSTCDPISLRFGPFSYGNISGGGFPTTCCGGAPGADEESTFYVWVTE